MKPIVLLALSVIICAFPVAAQDSLSERMARLPAHPRLFWPGDEVVRGRIAKSPELGELTAHLRTRGRALLDTHVLAREQIGRRLLSVSREAVQRVVLLAFLYRESGDKVYLDRAEAEMLAISGFKDWNPPHFLDVAEMTTAMAIGYDWLHHALPEESRGKIRAAIIEKGLQPALEKYGIRAAYETNNWNPVCNGGTVIGSLAVAEAAPEIAAKITARAIKKLPQAMDVYEPDGVYPEEPAYWNYGITYNVMLIAALESALGSDFGLADRKGFRETGAFMLQATGPSGLSFNFSDSSNKREVLIPMFWLANHFGKPALAANETALLKKQLGEAKTSGIPPRYGRFDPFMILWPALPIPENGAAQPMSWTGGGHNPVAFHRTSWDAEQAVYLAIKAGMAGQSHGHMDNGSFVIDAHGLRWASDPMQRSYEEMEAAGVDYWGREQTSDRWKVWECAPFSHNTLTIDGQLHQSEGRATIIRYSADPKDRHSVVDLTSTLRGQVTKALRGFRLDADGRVIIHDEIEGMKPGAELRWAIHTPADVALGENSATLSQLGKTLHLTFSSSQLPALAVEEQAVLTPPYRRPIPGYRQLIAKVRAGADGKIRLTTIFGKTAAPAPASDPWLPLEKWSAPIP